MLHGYSAAMSSSLQSKVSWEVLVPALSRRNFSLSSPKLLSSCNFSSKMHPGWLFMFPVCVGSPFLLCAALLSLPSQETLQILAKSKVTVKLWALQVGYEVV